jgi:hypothetical protein
LSGKNHLVSSDGELLTMQEEPYAAEAVLQRLLVGYPDLLAGDQMRPTAPRRWLLVTRELRVPGGESEKARWSLDHLFIDQEGIPTLVEVKRSSNTQIRREVVGQMLDYAANGTLYWSLDQITAAFDRRCERDGHDPDDAIRPFLGDDTDWEAAEFWQAVKGSPAHPHSSSFTNRRSSRAYLEESDWRHTVNTPARFARPSFASLTYPPTTRGKGCSLALAR